MANNTPSVRLLFGPMLIGVFLNTILYGVLVAQTYSYYREYKKDLSWIRLLVCYVFILETINTAFNMFVMYEPLILRYGQPLVLYPTLFAAEPMAVAAISAPIQFFFAWRIKAFTRSIWIPLLICILGILSLAGGLWTGIRIAIVKLLVKKPEFHTPALVWFLSACAADLLITATLVFNLSRRRTGFDATDDAITKIMRTTVQTGMLTTICAVGDVVFFMTIPHAAFNIAFDLTLAKLYGNCLMSTLNARKGLAEVAMRSTGPMRHFGDSDFDNSRVVSGVVHLGDHVVKGTRKLDISRTSENRKSLNEVSPVTWNEPGIKVTKAMETIDEELVVHRRETTQ